MLFVLITEKDRLGFVRISLLNQFEGPVLHLDKFDVGNVGFGGCFGVLDRTVFLATIFGLYRSEDEGKTWTFMPDALTQEQTGHKHCGNFGPRMVIHPDKGLVIPVGGRGPFLNLYYSKDRGVTWQHERIANLAGDIRPAEPTAIYHDGHLVFDF